MTLSACGQSPQETTLARSGEAPGTSTTSFDPGGAGSPPSSASADPSTSTVPTTGATAPEPASPGTTGPPGTSLTSAPSPPAGSSPLAITEVATGLDTVWSMAWDPEGQLWFTERSGRLTRLGDPAQSVAGVVESGEGGLMGLEIDASGARYVMYTSDSDNRVVRLADDGGQDVLVEGIAKADIHNGGRIRLGPDGALYVSAGDAGRPEVAAGGSSLNGKVLRVDRGGGGATVFSRGHRNVQGLCFDAGGRLLATEHGPDRGDEINVVRAGQDGGWPTTVGNGIRNYTPTIAPAGCVVYNAGLIPQWRGSLLFVTLKERDLRRLTFGPDGSVTGEEVLYDGAFGRLRDVSVGPDGAVYLATSNRDGRGSPGSNDDRILRLAPR